jgi:hypothetical protein
MVHLRSSASQAVVAVPVLKPSSGAAEGNYGSHQRPLELIQGSLSARRVERQSPVLGNLHRVADGALAGLGVAVLGLCGLTLHWQGQWTQNFQKLEAAQRLEHRLQESAAVLEQHHLGLAKKPGLLVPTSSEKLVYVEAPKPMGPAPMTSLLAGVSTRQILAGY